MKQDLEELTINEKGEITTLDDKVVSELHPIGRPQMIAKSGVGMDRDMPLIYYIKVIADPSVQNSDFSGCPIAFLQGMAKPHPKANAYLVGDEIYNPDGRFLYHQYFAVQFYKIKHSGGKKK